jgi:hypothetical protein
MIRNSGLPSIQFRGCVFLQHRCSADTFFTILGRRVFRCYLDLQSHSQTVDVYVRAKCFKIMPRSSFLHKLLEGNFNDAQYSPEQTYLCAPFTILRNKATPTPPLTRDKVNVAFLSVVPIRGGALFCTCVGYRNAPIGRCRNGWAWRPEEWLQQTYKRDVVQGCLFHGTRRLTRPSFPASSVQRPMGRTQGSGGGLRSLVFSMIIVDLTEASICKPDRQFSETKGGALQ